MIQIRLLGTKEVVKELEKEKDLFIARLAQDTLEVARQKTPIDKGQARRGWRLETLFKQKRVVNRVPYAVHLEEGHSKQAPNGILGPTMREISTRRYT
jgi:hypothetical protein